MNCSSPVTRHYLLFTYMGKATPFLLPNFHSPFIVSEKQQQAGERQGGADDEEHHPSDRIGEVSCRRPRHIATNRHEAAQESELGGRELFVA